MRRHPIKLALLILGLAISGIVIYLTAQMRMRTPPQITVARLEWLPSPDVPHAYLKTHYEIKNPTLFPVRIYMVCVLGPESMIGGDIDFDESGKDSLLIKPGEIYKGSVTILAPAGESSIEGAFLIRWEPGIRKRLRPLLDRFDSTKRQLLNTPSDPFTPAGTPPPKHPPIVWPQNDLLEPMHFGLPRNASP
ncbi:MAG TPA: hypothetical protein VLE43_05330 [Candidatus Saccharimonadia bacterium]|nr:hypothetical protein [Candidatus Saccharimonadia bacterium]